MPRSTRSPRHLKLIAFLVEARGTAGLTQEAVAKALNRPQSFVAKYEGGERRLDVIELIEVCEVLGINPTQAVEALLLLK